MDHLKSIKELIKKSNILLKEKYKIKNLGIFGSYARGTFRQDSDIDILVEFSEVPDFFQFIRVEKELENILGKKVDLVTRQALKPSIKQNILEETIYL